MNRKELKTYVTQVLLEKINTTPNVVGKLLKKQISFNGIRREVVCEGTVDDANNFANENNLTFTGSFDSHFGGHYNDEMTSFEFHPNAEFYGHLMELNMTSREQLLRISGKNNQILTEVCVKNVEELVEYIFTDDVFITERTNLVFDKINKQIKNKLYDKTQFNKLFEYLFKQVCVFKCNTKPSLNEVETEFALKLISNRYFSDIKNNPTNDKTTSTIYTKSFKNGTAFENMQRIVSGQKRFL